MARINESGRAFHPNTLFSVKTKESPQNLCVAEQNARVFNTVGALKTLTLLDPIDSSDYVVNLVPGDAPDVVYDPYASPSDLKDVDYSSKAKITGNFKYLKEPSRKPSREPSREPVETNDYSDVFGDPSLVSDYLKTRDEIENGESNLDASGTSGRKRFTSNSSG